MAMSFHVNIDFLKVFLYSYVFCNVWEMLHSQLFNDTLNPSCSYMHVYILLVDLYLLVEYIYVDPNKLYFNIVLALSIYVSNQPITQSLTDRVSNNTTKLNLIRVLLHGLRMFSRQIPKMYVQ